MIIRRYLGLAAVLVATTTSALAAGELKTDLQKFSYAAGAQVGQGIKQQGSEIDAKSFAQGIEDALSGDTMKLTLEEMKAAFESRQKAEAAKRETEGKANLQAGKAYLEANKKKTGVTTLPSGLQYKVITNGSGKFPKPTDTVEVHYRGTLINGTEFDSSIKRNAPATFPVNGVIKGWQEVLPLMKVGSKWEVVIPSSLAYAERGSRGSIGPNETLVFEIELLSIKDSGAKK